jgi:hypothetical protein
MRPDLVTVTMPWKALHGQFGRSVARLDHFKDHFRTVIALATSVYPDANIDEAANGSGLILRPSKPPVSPRSGMTNRGHLTLAAASR